MAQFASGSVIEAKDSLIGCGWNCSLLEAILTYRDLEHEVDCPCCSKVDMEMMRGTNCNCSYQRLEGRSKSTRSWPFVGQRRQGPFRTGKVASRKWSCARSYRKIVEGIPSSDWIAFP